MYSRVLILFAALAALANGAVIPRETTTTAVASNIISVPGTGHVDIPTTETKVSASIQKTITCDDPSCNGSGAQEEVATAAKSVLDYLKSLDSVSELSTTNVQLQPQMNYTDSPPTLTGYQATTSISFKVDNENAGEVLDEIVKKGVTNIDSVSFTASDAAVDKATQEALKKAVANAQMQADAVLSAINAKSEGIVSVQVGNASPPPPVPGPMFASAEAPAGGANTQIEAGTQTVSASVTLNIKYSQS